MPSLVPYLIEMVKQALRLRTYPNLFYLRGSKSFCLRPPRLGSEEFTDANIQLFRDWDVRRNRHNFDYSSSRQRVLSALKRSVYLTVDFSGKDIYLFHFNNAEEKAAKRAAQRRTTVSENYTSDGENAPSSPELLPSPPSGTSDYYSNICFQPSLPGIQLIFQPSGTSPEPPDPFPSSPEMTSSPEPSSNGLLSSESAMASGNHVEVLQFPTAPQITFIRTMSPRNGLLSSESPMASGNQVGVVQFPNSPETTLSPIPLSNGQSSSDSPMTSDNYLEIPSFPGYPETILSPVSQANVLSSSESPMTLDDNLEISTNLSYPLRNFSPEPLSDGVSFPGSPMTFDNGSSPARNSSPVSFSSSLTVPESYGAPDSRPELETHLFPNSPSWDMSPVISDFSFPEDPFLISASDSQLGGSHSILNSFQNSQTADVSEEPPFSVDCNSVKSPMQSGITQEFDCTPYEFKPLSLGDEFEDLLKDHLEPHNVGVPAETTLCESNMPLQEAPIAGAVQQSATSTPTDPTQENVVVQLGIDEISTSQADVTYYLVSVRKSVW